MAAGEEKQEKHKITSLYFVFIVLEGIVAIFFAFVNFFSVQIFDRYSLCAALVCIALFLLFFFAFKKFSALLKAHIPVFLTAVLILSFGLRLAFVLTVQTQPISDFNVTYLAAGQYLQKGPEAYSSGSYFAAYPFMIIYSLWEALILHLFHSMLAIKVINVILMTASNALIYFVAEKITSSVAALFAAFLYAALPEILFMTSVLTNQIPATFFFLLCVWFLVSADHRIRNYIFAGISLAVSNLFRPEAITLLAALVLWGIVFLRQKRKIGIPWKQCGLSLMKSILPLFLVYSVIMGAASSAVRKENFCKTGLNSTVISWKFMCGLNPESGGGFVDPSHFPDYIRAGSLQEKDAAGKAYIRKNISAILKAEAPLRFFERKNENMWNGLVYSSWSCYGLDQTRTIAGRYTIKDFLLDIDTVNQILSLIVWTSIAAGLLSLMKQREFDPNILLLSLLLFTTFGAYCLIEYQTRYRFNTMGFAVILAALSFDHCIERKCKKSRPSGSSAENDNTNEPLPANRKA